MELIRLLREKYRAEVNIRNDGTQSVFLNKVSKSCQVWTLVLILQILHLIMSIKLYTYVAHHQGIGN